MNHRKWETVKREDHDRHQPANTTERMRVPGGWLYRTMVKTLKTPNGYGMEVAMCFVPDPKDD